MLWDNFESFLFTQKLCIVWVGDTIIYNDQVLVAQRFLGLFSYLQPDCCGRQQMKKKQLHAFLRK